MSESEDATVGYVMPSPPQRRRERGRGARRGDVRTAPVLLENGQDEATNSNHEENGNIIVAQTTRDEGVVKQSQSETSVGITAPDVSAMLQTEFVGFMASVTGVLNALFSMITSPQVSEMESSHDKEIKDNELLSNCIDQAKSY